MASDDTTQLTTAMHRLSDLANAANPITAIPQAISLLCTVISECAHEPAGDPDRLDRAAAAFGSAATAVDGLRQRADKLSGQRLPDIWHGLAGGTAQTAVAAITHQLGDAQPVFGDLHGTLGTLAHALRDAKARHAAGRGHLQAAQHELTAGGMFGLVPDILHLRSTLSRAISEAVEGLRGCIGAYETAAAAERQAASRLREAAGRARVGAESTGARFSALDAVVLADQAYGSSSVSLPYDDGVLSPAQLARATQALDGLSPQDYATMQALLAAAGSDKERAYLLKALAAGHPVGEVQRFAGMIRGKPSDWLDQHLTLVHPGSDQGFSYTDANGETVRIDQYDETTCGSTAILATRSMADPLFTLDLTTGGNPDDPSATSAAEFEKRLSAEEQRIHDQSTAGKLGPFNYPQAIGTPPWGVADQLNQYGNATGTQYGSHWVDNTDAGQIDRALSDVEASVDSGQPVPVLIGDGVPRHYVLVIGHHGGDLQIYEPTSGRTVTVSETDFRDGTPAFANAVGYPNVQAVVTPDHK
jgi:hypothetical protein